MLNRFILLILSFYVIPIDAQVIVKRIIIVGDAGLINDAQQSIIKKATDLVIPNKTIAFFVGDNIYEYGMPLEEGAERDEAIKGLQSQYQPFRAIDVPVYFLAGNHDWNHSKKGGLERVIAQEEFLKSENDNALKFIPKAGTAGPIQLPLHDGLVGILYDSEYWVYPFHGSNQVSESKRKEFVDSLCNIIERNLNKRILIISHHPMRSFGEHGLSFGLKQHIFPLTRINKKLYIPLPIIGSLYPIWRKTISKSAEDLPHAVYQSLITDVLSVASKHSNVLYVAGHDHGLQYIEDGAIRQIVSGSGAKTSYIRDHKNLQFKYEKQGFSSLDFMSDESIILTYYIYNGAETVQSFVKVLPKN